MNTGTGPATAAVGLLDDVSGERMASVVATLAGDPFTGRRVGSTGGAAARAWLGAHLTGLGAAVEVDPFPVRSVPEVYAAPHVTVHDSAGTRRLVSGRQVGPHPASADVPLTRRGRLAVAGAGDPAGAWLVVPAGMSLFDAYGHAENAAGLLIGRPVDADGWQYTMLAGPGAGPLPVLGLDPDSHAALRTAASTDSGELSATAPIRRLDVPAANLYARFRGGARVEVLLSAHFDGVGDLPGLRQAAAADNAGGVAVVCEAARLLAAVLPDGVGLSVALLDGEEMGALGSAHHAARLTAAGARPLVINVDGVGHLQQAAAVEAGGPAHALLAALDQAGRHTGVPLAAGPVASDNRRYAAAGLPAIGIGAGMAGYHSPADTADRVDPDTLTVIARLVIATVLLTAHDNTSGETP
jgi:aminopeptidase YwaD